MHSLSESSHSKIGTTPPPSPSTGATPATTSTHSSPDSPQHDPVELPATTTSEAPPLTAQPWAEIPRSLGSERYGRTPTQDPRSIWLTAAVCCAKVPTPAAVRPCHQRGCSRHCSCTCGADSTDSTRLETQDNRRSSKNRGALRRCRDFARHRWPLRGSSGHGRRCGLPSADGCSHRAPCRFV